MRIMLPIIRVRWAVLACLVAAAAVGGCRQTPAPAPKQYPLKGQILAVNANARELTINHEDIAGFMPAMTMVYPVANAALLDGRTAGDLVSGTLEVSDSVGRIVALTHVGSAPLPANNGAALSAGILAVGDEAPDAAFLDQADRRRVFSEFRGSITLVTFIFTRCPDPNFCPLIEQNLAAIQRQITADASLRGKVQLVAVSFDPEHDTPAVLATHAAARKADPAVWTFLTGDGVTIEKFAARFGVSVVRQGTPVELAHTLRTVLIEPGGKVHKIYAGNEWKPATVVTDMRALAR